MSMDKKPHAVASKASGTRRGGGRNKPDGDQTAPSPGHPFMFNNFGSQGTRRACFAPRVVATAAKMDLKRELRKNHAYALLQPCDKDEPVPGETEKEKKRRMNRINARRKRARRVLRLEHLTEQYHDLTERNGSLTSQNNTFKSCINIVKDYMRSNASASGAPTAASLQSSNDLNGPARKLPPAADDFFRGPNPFSSQTDTPVANASFNTTTAVGTSRPVAMAQSQSVAGSQSIVTEAAPSQGPVDLNTVAQLLLQQVSNGSQDNSTSRASSLEIQQATSSRAFCGSAPSGRMENQDATNQSPELTNAISSTLFPMAYQNNSMSSNGVGYHQQAAAPTFSGHLASPQATQALQQASAFVHGKRDGFSSATYTGLSSLPASGVKSTGNNPMGQESHPSGSNQNVLDLPGLPGLMAQLCNMLRSQNMSSTAIDALIQFVIQLQNQSTSSTANAGQEQAATFNSNAPPAYCRDDTFSSATGSHSGAQHSLSAQYYQPSMTGSVGTSNCYMPSQAQQEGTNYRQSAPPAPAPAPSLNRELTDVIMNAAATNPDALVKAWNLLASSVATSSSSTATSG